MKKMKIAALIMVAIMTFGLLVSCSSAPATKVKISFFDEINGEFVVDSLEVELNKENPTVMDAVIAVKDKFATMEGYADIEFTADGSSVKDVDNCKEDLDGDELQFWQFFVNGEEPKGDASDVAVKDGDVIVYNFVSQAKNENN